MQKKLKVGWFSFTCCEDSTIIFTEMLNDHYLEWKKIIDFHSALVLQKKQDLSDFDVVFIEGAITSPDQEKKLVHLRSLSKILVAIGSCAVIGMPSSQRNAFDQKTNEEISPLLLRFRYSDKVKKIADLVKVDDAVPGCPMDEKIFVEVLDKYLKKFGII